METLHMFSRTFVTKLNRKSTAMTKTSIFPICLFASFLWTVKDFPFPFPMLFDAKPQGFIAMVHHFPVKNVIVNNLKLNYRIIPFCLFPPPISSYILFIFISYYQMIVFQLKDVCRIWSDCTVRVPDIRFKKTGLT